MLTSLTFTAVASVLLVHSSVLLGYCQPIMLSQVGLGPIDSSLESLFTSLGTVLGNCGVFKGWILAGSNRVLGAGP